MSNRQSANSPLDLRDNDDTVKTLETYHPRILVRQPRIESENDNNHHSDPMSNLENKNHNNSKQSGGQTQTNKWLSRFTSSKSPLTLKDKLTQKIARLSSLDSTRTSSSTEVDSSNNDAQQQQQQQKHRSQPPIMPLISITSNDVTANHSATSYNQRSQANPIQRKHEQYNNYYGRSRIGLAHDKDNNDKDEDDDDDFYEPSLTIPYSSSSMSRSTIVRQQTDNGVTYPSTSNRNNYYYEDDLLDDRQGMNKIEQHFTKGEKFNRPSVDLSVISELRSDRKKSSSPNGSGSGAGKNTSVRKDKQRRSKSPSSSSVPNLKRNRHSRRGFFGLASRLKLTRKYESIAKLQLSILNSGFVSLKTMDKDLQTFLPKERMAPNDFEERVKLMRKYEVLSNIEYRFASRYETYVCRHAVHESNQAKNNYKKCIPYDYNRVVLKTLPNVPDSDYINASHVDSYLKPNAYIAAQGPNENTIEDFWRMIWEQKTFVVVMLTKVFDFIRVMCNQYWPVELNKPERYGTLEVTLLYEEPLADFVIRTIKLKKLPRNNQTTELDQKEKGNETNQGEEEAEAVSTVNKKDTGLIESEDDYDYTEDDDDDDGDGDETSASDDLILNEDHREERPNSSKNLPSVRLPKYVSKPRRRDRKSACSSGGSGGCNREIRAGSDPNRLSTGERVTSPALLSFDLAPMEPKSTSRSSSQPPEMREGCQPPNEFLHPLFNSHNLAVSSGSISGSTSATPMTPPRTPNSAGLDRSSATRKAVKKKRRARKKNLRPLRTQFQVPNESQLLDDDDEDNNNNNISGTTNSIGTEDNTRGGKGQINERIIYQFHYNSWASHTCPFVNSLLHFRRRVRICMDEMSKSGKTGPTVVHCNDGCGRTGTYLCIDANLELAEEDNVYDVFNYTKTMRRSRKFLIENLEQYKFVYDTIEEAMFCGKTWFPVSELHKRLKHKSQRNPLTKKNEYLREYEKITRMTSKFSIGDCAGGHRVENREKNRDVSTVPPDNFRPYLTSFQTNDSTDYINAVFVDGYTRSKEYIVTEWPLHRTISDFWSLIYDHDCNSVILLANPGESSSYPSFLPSEKELRRKFGPVFSAEMVSYTHYQNIKSWIYTISKKIVSLTEVIAGVKSEAKTTQVFQITCWPQGHRVPTSTNALVELMNMVERWRQRTAYGPVCVVSLNGKSRAGVYCAANVAIEQVVQHSEVDVFQAVKTVRRHRPQLIENMTEYKYCYDLILHYVLHYVNQNQPSN